MDISPELWVPLTSMLTAVGGAVGRALSSRRVKDLEAKQDTRENYWKQREDKLEARIKELELERDDLEEKVDGLVRQRAEREAICENCGHVHECPWRLNHGGSDESDEK